jgi:hypothetical protein
MHWECKFRLSATESWSWPEFITPEDIHFQTCIHKSKSARSYLTWIMTQATCSLTTSLHLQMQNLNDKLISAPTGLMIGNWRTPRFLGITEILELDRRRIFNDCDWQYLADKTDYIPPSPPEEGNATSFRNVMLTFSECWTMDRVRKPSCPKCLPPSSLALEFENL